MQKGAIKAVVLTVIFFVAVGVFSMMTNHVNEDRQCVPSDGGRHHYR